MAAISRSWRWLHSFATIGCLLVLAGCSSMRPAASVSLTVPDITFDSAVSVPAPSFGGGADGRAESMAEAPAARAAPAPEPQAAAGAVLMADTTTAAPPPPPGAPPADAPQTVERKRVYSGFLQMIVADVEVSKRTIMDMAEELGGYVESAAAGTVVIRVPAATFAVAMATIEELGDTAQRVVQTADVTEQFADLQQRRDLAERTRERLYRLLERTEDTDERVRILREIRRLTEEIEQIANSLASLAQLVSMSRITVALTPRLLVDAAVRDGIRFGWIAALNPLTVSTGLGPAEIGVEAGDDFAIFEEGARFLAESATGARIRIGAVDNDPAGDDEFWQRALGHSLDDLYRESERLEIGEIRALAFRSKDRAPFTYVVGVRVDGAHLWVAELFLPNDDVRDALQPQLLETLEAIVWP